MKLSIVALIIASTIALSACEDKEALAQLKNAQQEIIQLKADLAKSQNELMQKNAEIPTLFVKKVDLFQNQATFKQDKSIENNYEMTSSIEYRISTVETDYPWLNNLLYQEMLKNFTLQENNQKQKQANEIANLKERLLFLIEYSYQQDLEIAKGFGSFGNENLLHLQYIGQRQNILSFSKTNYIYSGGAHGMGWTDYINIDTETKSILQLSDLFTAEQQIKVKELIWQSYKEYQYQLNPNIKEEDFIISKEAIDISNNFYFNEEGINFVYPPYAIGSYAEGEINLKIWWSDLEHILNKKYLW